MDRHNGNYIPSPSWPEGDFFFGTGVQNLIARLEPPQESSEYFFINLNGYTLSGFFKGFFGNRAKKIIIISSQQLMPLALFWLHESERVCAVFESRVPVEEIIRILNATPASSKISFPELHTSEILTMREVFFLSHYMQKGHAVYIQQRYSIKLSTLKNWKTSLACKLGVRKLEHLLM